MFLFFFSDTSKGSYELSFERQNVGDYATKHWSSLVSTLTAAMWIKNSAPTKVTLFTFGSTTDAMLQFNVEDATNTGYGISAAVSYWQADGPNWEYVNFLIKITRLFVVFDRNSFSRNNPIRV